MRIGLLTSGFDMFYLFRFLNKYDFDYYIYFDWNNTWRGDKGFNDSLVYVEKGIEFLLLKGVDYIILPPVYELHFLDKYDCILPLFKNFVFDYCFKYSLKGKIGLVGDFSDMEVMQDKLEYIIKFYELTENQKNTKKFNFPFSWWCKDTSFWKYFLSKFSFRNWVVNKTIKYDLKYFKDAAVDTIIPLNWGYMSFQKAIQSKLNFNRIRFHGINKLERCFEGMIDQNKQNSYSVKVFSNGVYDFLLFNKKWIRLLQRGREIKLDIERID